MAAVKNIEIDQGATHVEIFNVEVLTDPTEPYNALTNPYIPFDLTSYSARMQVRKTYDSSTVELSLTNLSGITLGGSTGEITINFSAANTENIKFTGESLDCVYDLELVNGSIVKRVVQGSFIISRNTTR